MRPTDNALVGEEALGGQLLADNWFAYPRNSWLAVGLIQCSAGRLSQIRGFCRICTRPRQVTVFIGLAVLVFPPPSGDISSSCTYKHNHLTECDAVLQFPPQLLYYPGPRLDRLGMFHSNSLNTSASSGRRDAK